MAARMIPAGKPASGPPAGALKAPKPAFSYYEIYSRAEGLEASRQRLYRQGDSLVKAIHAPLVNSVMGSGAASDEVDYEQEVSNDSLMESDVIKPLSPLQAGSISAVFRHLQGPAP